MKQATKRKRRWRLRTWLFVLSGFGGIVALLYWDQIPLLYVLSTAVLTILLIIVAFSNLKDEAEPAQNADEAEPTTAAYQKSEDLPRKRRQRVSSR